MEVNESEIPNRNTERNAAPAELTTNVNTVEEPIEQNDNPPTDVVIKDEEKIESELPPAPTIAPIQKNIIDVAISNADINLDEPELVNESTVVEAIQLQAYPTTETQPDEAAKVEQRADTPPPHLSPVNLEPVVENDQPDVDNPELIAIKTETENEPSVPDVLPREHNFTIEHTETNVVSPAVTVPTEDDATEVKFHAHPEEATVPETISTEETYELEYVDEEKSATEMAQPQIYLINEENSSSDNMIIVSTESDASPVTVDTCTVAHAQMHEVVEVRDEDESAGDLSNDTMVHVIEASSAEEALENLAGITVLEISEEPDDEDETAEAIEEVEIKQEPRHGRPTTIPSHVLGRNVNNPLEDAVRNGRVPPKPRLGVKVPYRNLTSQIVSKQDLADEIMERSRLRNSITDIASNRDVMFARNLTKRLAKKIAPVAEASTSAQEDDVEASAAAQINNNSDLLAILEGSDDSGASTSKSGRQHSALATPPATRSGTSRRVYKKVPTELEKQIALKQLMELPKHPKPTAFDKLKHKIARAASEAAAPTPPPPPPPPADEKPEVREDGPEPKFSSNLVTKTYSRKRRFLEERLAASMNGKRLSSDSASETEIKQETSHARSMESSPSDVYISKSSRIVKRKVIWDPDETSPKPHVKHTKVIEVKRAKSPDTVRRSTEAKAAKTPDLKRRPSDVAKAAKSTESALRQTRHSTVELKPTKAELGACADKRTPQVATPKNAEADHKSPYQKKHATSLSMKKKRLSEIDKLLMDEGAVNMLYAVKKIEEGPVVTKRVRSISIDRAQRELQDKADEVRNDLVASQDSTISLRSKDTSFRSPAKTSSSSRKSAREHISPPGSPDAFRTYPEASRLIRRHSSSSFSSVASNVEETTTRTPSNDATVEVKHARAEAVKGSGSAGKRRGRPPLSEAERRRRLELKETLARVKRERREVLPKRAMLKTENESMTEMDGVEEDGELAGMEERGEEVVEEYEEGMTGEEEVADDTKYPQFTSLKVVECENFSQILLTPSNQGRVLLCPKVLKELTCTLNLLAEEPECRTVVFSSPGEVFCQGINYRRLIILNKEQRKNVADELAMAVKKYLLTLIHFPKPLIAAVNGKAVGLGVTMLPLFDVVLASDNSLFSTPYAGLGCAAEGGVLLTVPHVMHNSLASELLYNSRQLSAADAQKLGLVTRTVWPHKFNEEVLSVAKHISGQSLQGMQLIKKQLRHHYLGKVEDALNFETDLLVQRWTSIECQRNFSSYLLDK